MTAQSGTILSASGIPSAEHPADGVYLARWEAGRPGHAEICGMLAAPAATFLAAHPNGRHLYVTRELDDGAVGTLERRDDGTLQEIAWVETGGAGPCHLAIDRRAHYLMATNYGSGSLSVHPIEPSGRVGRYCASASFTGRGAQPGRQDGPHPHMAAQDPSGRWIISSDLGTDEVRVLRLNPPRSQLAVHSSVRLPPGSGPRHFAFGPSGHLYVTGELSSRLHILSFDSHAGQLQHLGSASATAARPTGLNHPADIAASASGERCYVANRGADCVTVFTAAAGEVSAVTDIASSGTSPRHLALTGGLLHVANHGSGSIAIFLLDRASGLPNQIAAITSIPRPACVLAA
jgi:6-phosphogluconolactonase (cycloisomerase 2 family)